MKPPIYTTQYRNLLALSTAILIVPTLFTPVLLHSVRGAEVVQSAPDLVAPESSAATGLNNLAAVEAGSSSPAAASARENVSIQNSSGESLSRQGAQEHTANQTTGGESSVIRGETGNYAGLMRRFHDLQQAGAQGYLAEKRTEQLQLVTALRTFVDIETERLKTLPVSETRRQQYLERLQTTCNIHFETTRSAHLNRQVASNLPS